MQVVSRRSWRLRDKSGTYGFAQSERPTIRRPFFRLRPYRYRMIARMCIPCGAARYVLEYGLQRLINWKGVLMAIDHVKQTDPEVASALGQELSRQRSSVELIASENFTSQAVIEAMGSVITAVARRSISSRTLHASALASCTVQSLRTSSRTPVQMPTSPHISPR